MNFTVQIEKQGFKGKAVIDFPTRAEKLNIIKELQALGYGAKDDAEDVINAKKLDLSAKMGEVVDARLVSLEVTHEESGTVISDKAMLDIYSEGQILVGVIANYILAGVSLGKDKS